MVLGAHPFYPQRGQESRKKALKGCKKALKATKRLQKASQKAGSQDLPDPLLKMRFFSTEIDAKRLQKASQKAGSPGFAGPAIKNAIF